MKKRFLSLLFLINLIAIQDVSGQLGNYWTLQVSTEGTLLSGALVAGKSNTAGFFYNPASMASNTESSFSFNTSLFRSYFLNFKNPFGVDTKLKANTSNFDPIFLSFFVPKKNRLNIKMGISLMGKQSTNFNTVNRIYLSEFSFPSVPNRIGDYEGIYSYLLRSSEYWLNFSLSKKFNERFSLGSTLIVAIRNLDYERALESNYVTKDISGNNFTASYSDIDNAEMYNVKLILKIGGIYSFNENSRIGLNITTSSLNIYGSGSNRRSIAQTNVGRLISDSTDLQNNDQLISGYSNNLKANYKSPFSIAIGYNMEHYRSKFGFAVEYFHQIDAYDLITGVDNNSLINTSENEVSEEAFLSLRYEQRSIVNFAISYERTLDSNFTILTGFRTNFSTSTKRIAENELYTYIQDIIVNYYHFTGGTTFTLLRNKFILGIDFAFSLNNNHPNLVNFSEPLVFNDQSIPLRGSINNNGKTTNIMLGFVFGYSFKF